MVILDVTIINVALPTIADYFHIKLSGLQWVVDGYTLTFAGLLLLVGPLSDVFGAKKIFQLGLISFSLAFLSLPWDFFSLLPLEQSSPSYLWIMIPFLAVGFGVSFATPAWP